jgi:hypothetical protein
MERSAGRVRRVTSSRRAKGARWTRGRPQKKNNRGPPWWVGGSEYEKGPGPDLFSRCPMSDVFILYRYRYRLSCFCFWFLDSPHPPSRNAQRREKKKIEKKSVLGFWSNFLYELFDTIFCKALCSVFELPSPKNTRKRDKTKEVEEKLTSKFWSKFLIFFRHGLFAKIFLWCF